MTSRERNILIVTAAAAAIFLGDRYVFTPYTDKSAALAADISAAQKREADNLKTARDARLANRRWAEMTSSGLKADAQTAESQMYAAVQDWARDAGINLTSLKRDNEVTDKQFRRIVFRAAATGNMSQVTRFLWRMQTAQAIPARVVDISVSSRKGEGGVDDLNMTVAISTLLLGPETERPGAAPRATPAAATATPTKEPA